MPSLWTTDFPVRPPPSQADAEILELLAASPIQALYEAHEAKREAGRPILSLSAGHRALMLASGGFDGLVRPAGEAPHVVRGSCRKEKYVAKDEDKENPDGTFTRVVTESERSVLVVRVLTADGELIGWES